MRYTQVKDDEQKQILQSMIAQREEAHFRAGADADALQVLADAGDEGARVTIAALRKAQEQHETVISGFRAALQRLNDPDRAKPNRRARRAK